MGTIAERDAKLNDAIRSGTLFEVFREVYHPEVEMYENDELAGKGVEANLEREKQFFGSIKEIRDFSVTRTAVNEPAGVSFAEMSFDCTLADGRAMKVQEVSMRQWKDGQIVREQFFYKP
jgi:hypothetical protein